MSAVIRLLRQDHANMAKLLDVLEGQVTVLDATGAADFQVIEGILDYFLTYPELFHHALEDLVLQKLRARDAAHAGSIGDLDVEHRKIATLTRTCRSLLDDVLTGAELPRGAFRRIAREFLGLYWQHMKLEEERFFPAAEGKLIAADWKAIDREITEQRDPLFDLETDERFDALRNGILTWERIERGS